MTRFVVLSLGIVLAAPTPSFGQSSSGAPSARAGAARSSEEGRPLLRTYQPIEIGGGSQIWCILQDRRGVLYFGANSAVLEFDGASWRRIPVGTTGAAVRSMAIDDNGRIYIGAVGTFGYLEPDVTGVLHFASLMDRVPRARRPSMTSGAPSSRRTACGSRPRARCSDGPTALSPSSGPSPGSTARPW